MKYACVSKYFDDGRVFAAVYKVGPEAKNSYTKKTTHSEYVDVFTREEEAIEHRNAALEEGE